MRRESPIKRRNPSGKAVWVARYAGDGKHHIAKPAWNRGKGTFTRKSEAQRAIDEAYDITGKPDTLGEYFETWIERHPRSERTNANHEHRAVWKPTQEASGLNIRPHECRHSYVTHLCTADINDADLAEIRATAF